MNAVTKIEPKEQPIAVVSESSAILAVIQRAATDPAVDVTKMERLMQMHDRIMERQAERDFNTAMNSAQSEIGRVAADKQNTQTHSWYATYAELDREVRPVYSAHGFALSFNTEPSERADVVRVVCYVSHSAGHTRTYRVDMPADGKGAKGGDVMTKTHAAGSAMSYGKRYLLQLIFNTAIGVDPDDDDGSAASSPFDPAWAQSITDAVDAGTLKKIKADMVTNWKGATNIPKELVSAYNLRFDALREAAKHE